MAARVGFGQSKVSRIERAAISASIDDVDALFRELGIDVRFVSDGPFLADRQRQLDPAHALCVAYVRRRLEQAGWLVAQEVEVGFGRFRGWIDVLAFHPPTGRLLVVEVKTELVDVGGVQRQLGVYEREAWQAARRLGWRPTSLTSAVVFLATAAVDARIRENRDALAAAFPGRAAQLATWLSAETPGTGARFLALVDPSSHRRRWLQSTTIDGRRASLPYEDYRDFMGRRRR